MKIFSTKLPLRRGFTIAEVVLVLGVLGLLAGVSMPMYNRYQARNSMQIARQNIAQGIERAKFLAQTGMNDANWGFSTSAIPGRGVLFMGDSFLERDPSFDEMYSIPESVTITGLDEVVFSKITGLPTVTGTFTIISQYDEQEVVNVTLGDQGEVDVPEDWLDICINPYGDEPETIQVPDSLWISYQEQGALLGACSDIPASSSSTTSSSSSSSSSSSEGGTSSSASSEVGVGGEGSGEDIEVEDDGTVIINEDATFTAEIICTELHISSGYDAPITVRFKPDGAAYIEPWGDYTKPVDGNVNNTGVLPYTSDTIIAVDSVNIWARSYYKKKSWYDGSQNNHFNMNQQVWTPHEDILVNVLKHGDDVPNYEGAGGQPDVEECMSDYVYTAPGTGEKTMQLDSNQAMYLFELWTTDTSSPDADFQDLVLLVTFNGA